MTRTQIAKGIVKIESQGQTRYIVDGTSDLWKLTGREYSEIKRDKRKPKEKHENENLRG